MKKLILLELVFLFLATTFSSKSAASGMVSAGLPVDIFVDDIFFMDSFEKVGSIK